LQAERSLRACCLEYPELLAGAAGSCSPPAVVRPSSADPAGEEQSRYSIVAGSGPSAARNGEDPPIGARTLSRR